MQLFTAFLPPDLDHLRACLLGASQTREVMMTTPANVPAASCRMLQPLPFPFPVKNSCPQTTALSKHY